MPVKLSQTCQLDFDQVREISHLFSTRKSACVMIWVLFMNRHSASSSYLAAILETICGRLCVRGGNIFPGHLMPTGAHSDERNPKTWRTVMPPSFFRSQVLIRPTPCPRRFSPIIRTVSERFLSPPPIRCVPMPIPRPMNKPSENWIYWSLPNWL